MRILDLFQFSTFNNNKRVKVLRHISKEVDIWGLYKRNLFEDYQSQHGSDIFKNVDFIISFIGERHNSARYVGVWEILDKRKMKNGRYSYKTQKLASFDEFIERLIVDWGDGTRSWAQWLHKHGNKEVSEILPLNYVMEFPGYYELILSFSDLKKLIKNPDANREWYRMLSSVSGIYLILDTITGEQYVGSAYGHGGLWQRWKSYSKNPSGGNKRIRELLEKHPQRYLDFQFSVLRVLEHSSTKDVVVSHETLIKKKLGSKVFGLNSN
jgi:hypothetical protein